MSAFQAAYSLAPRFAQLSGARQSVSASDSSSTPTSASPTTASERCLTASKRAALRPMMRVSSPNTVHEAVTKSWSRVPMASTTSASLASALAEVEPLMPIGPTFIGWSWTSAVRPLMVSATGTLCFSAKAATASLASDQWTPPPATISGFFALRSSFTASRSESASGRARGMRWTVSSKKADGIVIGLGLGVLGEADEGRAAGRRVEHGGDRLRQRGDDLLGPGDAVPVARRPA